MKNYIIFILGSCLFCESCLQNSKKFEDNCIREIDIIANLTNIRKANLTTIAMSIEYCLMETNKKCLVTPRMSTYCSKEYVVTIGKDQNHNVCYVFDRKTGKFVRQISRVGRGPGEYTETISSFWDEDKEQICVFGNNQLYFYNLDGTISHQMNRFNHKIFTFIAYKDYYVGYSPNLSGNNPIRIAFYDTTGNFIDSIPNFRTWKRTQNRWGSSRDSWLYVFNNNLYFKELYCDTLYHIKDFTLYPRFVFNTNGLTVPYEEQEGGRYDIMAEISGKEYDRYVKYVNILKVLEDNKYLYFEIDYRKLLYPAVYDKMEDKLQIMQPVSIPPLSKNSRRPLHGFENDLDGGLPFWPQQIISDKEMMCVYTAEELLELDISNITDPNLKNVLNSINEESNPVVAIVKLKD